LVLLLPDQAECRDLEAAVEDTPGTAGRGGVSDPPFDVPFAAWVIDGRILAT
jgi:hypothetical protein